MNRLPTSLLIALGTSFCTHLGLYLYFSGEPDAENRFLIQMEEDLSSVRVELINTPSPEKPSKPMPLKSEKTKTLSTDQRQAKQVKNEPQAELKTEITPRQSREQDPPPPQALKELEKLPQKAPEKAEETKPEPISPTNHNTSKPLPSPNQVSLEARGAFLQQKAKAVHCPSPSYPRAARERKMEGTVILRLGVEADGSINSIRIVQSSGHRLLDRAAMKTVRKKWEFTPSVEQGLPIESSLDIEISFRLRN